jgi:non-heme chloroperoxidase
MATFIASDGAEIYYKDWGTGQPVIFSHGWPLDGDMWQSQMIYLASRGYRTIAFDRRGFGRSSQPWQGYGFDRLADDVAELIETLDLRDVLLVGFSMGGGEVVRYTGRHGSRRVAKLALISAVTPFMLKTDENPEGIIKSVFDGMRAGVQADHPQFIRDFSVFFYGTNRAGAQVSPGILEQTFAIAMRASLKATFDCIAAFSETDFRSDLKLIDRPTLIIHGDDDQTAPIAVTANRAAKLITDSTYKVYEGAPHATPITHKERVAADLLDFFIH